MQLFFSNADYDKKDRNYEKSTIKVQNIAS